MARGADQRGRCTNTELCVHAVAQRVMVRPAGAPFECPRCGGPLQAEAAAPLPRARSKQARVLQAAVVLAGVAALTLRMGSEANMSWVRDRVAALRSPAQATSRVAMALPRDSGAHVILRVAATDGTGSTLAPRLATKYLGLIGVTDVAVLPGVDGAQEISGQQAGQRDGITVMSAPMEAAFGLLGRGGVDVLLSTARPPDAEWARWAGTGGLAETAVAVQGIAVAVSPANPVASLTAAQLRGIYDGRITDWAEAGGTPGPIHIYLAPGRGAVAPDEAGRGNGGTRAVRITGDQAAAALAADRGGIGLLPAGTAGLAKLLLLGAAGGAVAPSADRVLDGAYPLTRQLFLYASPGNNAARRFADHVRSPAGQAILEASGFVSYTDRAERPPTARPAPEVTSPPPRLALAGTARLDLDVVFPPGARDLDRNGGRDVERIIAFVRSQRIAPGRLVLVGVVDGAAPSSQAAALQRAGSVATALAKAGITPGRVIVLGTDGQQGDTGDRSPRVEVYLTGL